MSIDRESIFAWWAHSGLLIALLPCSLGRGRGLNPTCAAHFFIQPPRTGTPGWLFINLAKIGLGTPPPTSRPDKRGGSPAVTKKRGKGPPLASFFLTAGAVVGPSQITKKGRGAPQITSATRKRGGQGGFWAQPPLGFSGFLGSMAEIFQRPRGGVSVRSSIRRIFFVDLLRAGGAGVWLAILRLSAYYFTSTVRWARPEPYQRSLVAWFTSR